MKSARELPFDSQSHSRISYLCGYARVLCVSKLSKNEGETEKSSGEREGDEGCGIHLKRKKKQVGELERKISKGAPKRHSRISSLCVYARVIFVYKLSENKGEAEKSSGEGEGDEGCAIHLRRKKKTGWRVRA